MAIHTVSLQSLGLALDAQGQIEITGLALDNRHIKAGDLFAVDPAKIVIAHDVRASFARAAALFYGGQPKTMVAVTGTNGKTSISSFCRQIWTELEKQAVNIGTTGVEGAFTTPLRHTTPDTLTLHRVLSEAKSAGITHAAMEASSHGLDQRRLDGVRIKAAGFANFTQDHLDYHKTFDAYFQAKAGLFDRVLPDDGTAVINIDDPALNTFADQLIARGIRTIRMGHDVRAELRIEGARFDGLGQDVRFTYQGKTYQKRLNLIGGFQAGNVLMAALLVIAAGEDPAHVFDTLEHLETVRGRMQFAAARENGASVYVDYAHTPDAVKTALQAFRPHVMGRMIAIIGAGGDRDATKRPLMAAEAVANADFVIVSDDNPRSEDPATIRQMVMAGAKGVQHILEIGDRAEAILRAVDMLGAGDGLIITGKGHETGQIIGDDVLPFDDVEQASVAVQALDGIMS
ncbi:MAG: UDP-N-acetylmuramoyl-L-alanyl-D-glutamate--2,6-diaminopimelate ligase [Rhodobacteraceae bacterium]|nr:UDP-N-acetylmuramoyl-L-alanyl-D-glutamate--2,6-diaminopimelate ligase [Paracoccaceae bacterium]